MRIYGLTKSSYRPPPTTTRLSSTLFNPTTTKPPGKRVKGDPHHPHVSQVGFEYSFTQTGIREGLSETLRALARTAPFARHRYALVDLANAVRPSTLF